MSKHSQISTGHSSSVKGPLLLRAAEQERRANFAEAAKTYVSYLRKIPRHDLFPRGEVLLRLSNAQFRGAMQSNDSRSFQVAVRHSISTLREAAEIFEKVGKDARGALYRTKAFEAYLEYWIAKNPAKKGQLLDESWLFTKKALRDFEASRRYLDYAETFQQLSVGVGIRLETDWRLASRIRKSREAAEHGKKTIGFLRSAGRKDDLTRALVRTALFLDTLSEITLESTKTPRFQEEALELWKEAQTISKEAAYKETSRPPQGFHRIIDQNQALSLYREALKLVEPENDKFANGWLTEKLAKWSFYAAEAVENPALRVKGHIEALHYAEEAAKSFDGIRFTSAGGGVLWVHSPYAEHFHQLATYESDASRRRSFQEKSLRSIPELLRLGQQSGHPPVISYAFHIGAKSAVTLADMETNTKRKVSLLREGLKHRFQAIKVIEQIEPVPSWNRGIMLRYLADIQAKLAELAETPRDQIEMLEKAALTQENGLKLASDYVQSLERVESHVFKGPIGRYHFERASVLQRLNLITHDPEHLREAAQEYTNAADWFQRAGRPSGAAECYWKSAEAYDSLHAHSLASDNFLLAAEAYDVLGKKILPLKDFSRDYSRYLTAWSKIELARSMHRNLRYDRAALSYQSVARLHRSTRRWRFLSPYYSAWSRFESGENLSRNGQRTKALKAFRQAADLFAKSVLLLKDRLPNLYQPDEKKMVSSLVSSSRKDYCQARIILEEAMIAESEEDYQTSFEKFGRASEKLRELSEHSDAGPDRNEIGFLSTLCTAWMLSNKAELEGSVEVLQEAVAAFGRATRNSPSQISMKLARGHEEFARALIASRRYGETLDANAHREATKCLDLASNYYLDAGFKTAAENAMGRKLLLDAFDRLNEANDEPDPKKKTELYLMTSSLLRGSVAAFSKAHEPMKMELAKGLLKRARTESRIASHMTEILKGAVETSTNVAFHTPAQGNEKPVGLGRFDRADIEIRLSDITKGQRSANGLELRYEITNTGKQPIDLVRLDQALPDHAELVEPLKKWRLHGGSMVPLQSRRINTLQTEAMNLTLRVSTEGLLKINPKAIFTDSGGVQYEHVLEPKVVATSRIIEFLGNSFVQDYVSKRLAVPSCGWRTLMEIVQELKIPRSHVYGELRYGRTFGKQLDALVKSLMVEYRIFPGERGRGGEITKVRVQLNNADVRAYLGESAPGLVVSDLMGTRSVSSEIGKDNTQIIASP